MIRLDRLKQAREKSGLSQEEVSRHLGFESHTAYYRKEHGHRRITADELVKLSELFGVSLVHLAGTDEAPPTQPPPA